MFNNDGDLDGFEDFRPASSSNARGGEDSSEFSSTPICSSREFDPKELLARLRNARNKTQPTQRASCNRTPIPTGPQPSAALRSMRNSIIGAASLRNGGGRGGNPGSRVIPRASCRRETSVIRERLGEPPLTNPRKFPPANLDSPIFAPTPTPPASSFSPSSAPSTLCSSRPVSALQAAFERQQNKNKCSLALSQQPQPTATCNRLAVPTAIKFPLRSLPSSTPKPMAVVAPSPSPSPSTSPSISPSPSPMPSSSTGLCSRCTMKENLFKSQLSTPLTTSVTSFMVPESVGGEIFIKTPVQVEIVKASHGQKTLRGNSQCPVHHNHHHHRPSMDRFKYTEYAKVHELNFDHYNNCTRGLSTLRHGPGAPTLCGRCVPPPPQQQRRSISMAPPPRPQRLSLTPKRGATPGCGCGSAATSIGVRNGCGQVKSYEDIIRECEEKFAKERRREEINCPASMGMEKEADVEPVEGKKEEKSSNFMMSMIKDFTNALGSVGGEKAKPEIVVTSPTPPRSPTPQPVQMERKPSIVVTPPTPERETVPVPTPRSVEREPSMASEGIENFSRPLVRSESTPGIAENSEAIPKIVISDWDVPKIVLEEGQQERLGLMQSNITASDCGFCRRLGDLWEESGISGK